MGSRNELKDENKTRSIPVQACTTQPKHETEIPSPGSSNDLGQVCAVPLSHYQCPICLEKFPSTDLRLQHENNTHLSISAISPALSSENSVGQEYSREDEKSELFDYLNLKSIKTSSYLNDLVGYLNDKSIQLDIKVTGNELRSYTCHNCQYQTGRRFVLWAHLFTCCPKESDCDSKSNSFCFICECVLPKGTQYVKHIDRCIIKQKEANKNCKKKDAEETKYICDLCKADLGSVLALKQHIWGPDCTPKNVQ